MTGLARSNALTECQSRGTRVAAHRPCSLRRGPCAVVAANLEQVRVRVICNLLRRRRQRWPCLGASPLRIYLVSRGSTGRSKAAGWWFGRARCFGVVRPSQTSQYRSPAALTLWHTLSHSATIRPQTQIINRWIMIWGHGGVGRHSGVVMMGRHVWRRPRISTVDRCTWQTGKADGYCGLVCIVTPRQEHGHS